MIDGIDIWAICIISGFALYILIGKKLVKELCLYYLEAKFEKKPASTRSIINPIFYFDLFLIYRYADIISFEKEAKKQN